MHLTPFGPITVHKQHISFLLINASMGHCFASKRAKLFADGIHISPEFCSDASLTIFRNHSPINLMGLSTCSEDLEVLRVFKAYQSRDYETRIKKH